MEAPIAFNSAMSGNRRAAEDFADRLRGLCDSATDMGLDRLAERLDRLASEISAQAAHLDHMYSTMIHAEADANVRSMVSTINAALSKGAA